MASAAAKAGMPTTLASKDKVASHRWREREAVRPVRARAVGLGAPVLGPPVLGTPVPGPLLGTPVLGTPPSGALLPGVPNAGTLRLAPRPPVVLTPLPRSHGDRSSPTTPLCWPLPPELTRHSSVILAASS